MQDKPGLREDKGRDLPGATQPRLKSWGYKVVGEETVMRSGGPIQPDQLQENHLTGRAAKLSSNTLWGRGTQKHNRIELKGKSLTFHTNLQCALLTFTMSFRCPLHGAPISKGTLKGIGGMESAGQDPPPEVMPLLGKRQHIRQVVPLFPKGQ